MLTPEKTLQFCFRYLYLCQKSKHSIMKKSSKTFSFETTEVESDRIREFINEHASCRSKVTEKFGVSFIPTLLGGPIVHVRCLVCGETKEVTEIEKY